MSADDALDAVKLVAATTTSSDTPLATASTSFAAALATFDALMKGWTMLTPDKLELSCPGLGVPWSNDTSVTGSWAGKGMSAEGGGCYAEHTATFAQGAFAWCVVRDGS